MIPNKIPLYEVNSGVSEFIPTQPALNDALQNTEVPNMAFNKVTLQDMRDNPVLFDNTLSDLDKTAKVQQEIQKTMPEVEKIAQNFKTVKDSVKNGQKRF